MPWQPGIASRVSTHRQPDGLPRSRLDVLSSAALGYPGRSRVTCPVCSCPRGEPALSQHISSTWYENFFTELQNEFWRRAASPAMTSADIEFIESRFALTPRSRILDVPCGSGRHSIALAQRG